MGFLFVGFKVVINHKWWWISPQEKAVNSLPNDQEHES